MTYVYVAYGDKDAVLYVGIADHWPRRWDQHSYESPWFRRVRRLDIKPYASRAEAVSVEMQTIHALDPLFNIQRGRVPEKQRHLHCPLCGCQYLETPEFGWIPGGMCGDASSGVPADVTTVAALRPYMCRGVLAVVDK